MGSLKQGWKVLLVMAMVVMSVGAFSLPGMAAYQLASGENVIVGKAETVDGDFYSSAATTVVEGTITGDLLVTGQTVVINGRVDGSVIGVGNTLTVNGPVGGNIRAFFNSITLNGPVGKNVTLGSGTALISPSAVIGGGLISWNRQLEIQGTIQDDILAGVQTLRLGGKNGGFVKAWTQDLTVMKGAQIGGQLRYYSPHQATIPASARIAGGVKHEMIREEHVADWHSVGRLLGAVWLLGVILLGVLAWFLYPRRLGEATAPLGTTWTKGFLTGVIGLIVGPVVIGVAAVTLVGIPLALVLLAIFLVGMFFTLPLSGALAARQVIMAYFPSASLHPVVVALIGMAALLLVGWIPFLGPLIRFLAFILGFGLFLMAVNPVRKAAVKE